MAHDIDTHIGQRLRRRRWLLGMTQSQVGEKVGIKFQQIQKYETGQNRVSARRLWDLSKALDAPVTYFFEGVDGPHMRALAPASESLPADIMEQREAASLVRAYFAAPEPVRRRLYDLIVALGPDEVGAPGAQESADRSAELPRLAKG